MKPDTPPDESSVLDKVEAALKHVVRQHPRLSWEYGTRIKRQKYVYLAVRHFTPTHQDLPVTYSWYKFGAVMPAAPKTGTIGPASTEMPTPAARDSKIFTTEFDDLVSFFEDELTEPPLNAEFWFATDLDFLERFYNLHAPERYRDLYLSNIDFRRHLASAYERLENGFRTGEDDSNAFAVSESDYESIGRAAAKMHLALVDTAVVRETFEEVRRFTDLVEDAFLALTRTELSEVRQRQVDCLDELERTYSEWVWEYPALLISKDTAMGPNASVLRRWSEQKHFSVEDSLSNEIDAVENRCSSAGLTVAFDEYPHHHDELDGAMKRRVLRAMRRYE